MKVVTSLTINSAQYGRDIERVVADGYIPYGQPYMNGDYVYREFVKYEYAHEAHGFDLDEDDGFAFDDDDIEPQQPFETVDFFQDI